MPDNYYNNKYGSCGSPQQAPNGYPYMNNGRTPPPPPGPQYNGQPPYGGDPRYAPGYQPGPMPPYGQPYTKPDNYLAWAILSTVLCCLPLGIVSIVKACQVDNYWERGNYREAFDASSSAKKWAIISAIVTVAGWVLYVLLIAIFVAAETMN